LFANRFLTASPTLHLSRYQPTKENIITEFVKGIRIRAFWYLNLKIEE
jgi:hypothetical protein